MYSFINFKEAVKQDKRIWKNKTKNKISSKGGA